MAVPASSTSIFCLALTPRHPSVAIASQGDLLAADDEDSEDDKDAEDLDEDDDDDEQEDDDEEENEGEDELASLNA